MSTGSSRRSVQQVVGMFGALTLLLPVAACSGSETGSIASSAVGTSDVPSASGASDSTAVVEPEGPVAPLARDEAEAMLLTAEPVVPIGEAGSGLDEHLDDPTLLTVAREHLDAGAARWADVYVWINAGDEPAPLVPYLESDDTQIRMLAAIGAAARGEPGGLEVLIEALDDDDIFVDDPPRPVWLMASTYLAVFTASSALGPPGDATALQRRDAQERWRRWLSSSPTFDPVERHWSAPS